MATDKKPARLLAGGLVLVGILLSTAPVYAVCSPNAADGVTATCTGTTTNQNAPDGFGTSATNNLGVIVVQGATLAGTNNGIVFNTGSVVNSGTVTGTNEAGVAATTSATVTNSGTISGRYGVFSSGDATVTNSGNVTASNGDGVRAETNAIVTNSGTINAFYDGVFAAGSATVSNSGSITGGPFGIIASGDVVVSNTGSIAGGSSGISSVSGSATVTNSGTITAVTSSGIYGLSGLTLANSGTITSTSDGAASAANADVTNSGLISAGSGRGVSANLNATVTNTGTISASQGDAIGGYNVFVTNSGSVQAYYSGVIATQNATVTNSGTIHGENSPAIYAGSDALVMNSGYITANDIGVWARDGIATVTNSGTIVAAGPSGIGIVSGANGNVVNSGTIVGGSGTAIRFGNSTPSGSDSLTVLPGARFGGLVDFSGGADTVTFGPGSWILNTANFDKTLSSVTTAGNPYVVTPNQIIVADLSSFGAQNRAIMDITGWIASVLPDAPVFAPGAAGGVNAFAAADAETSPFAAFDSFPSDALGYAKAPVFKAANVTYADGNAVWAKAFGGQRLQDGSSNFVGGTTTGYGGAVGYERAIGPDLRIGALIGGSTNKTNLYLNAGNTNTDTVFAGAYGRKTWGATFLDLSVIGGGLDNANVRNVGGGLAFATANASYGGWFVNPAMMFGHRLDIDGRGFTVTPTMKVRYVAAHFDGYTEAGAGVADLAVAGRDFQAWEERAELTFANTTTLANGNRVTARVAGGMLGQQRSAGGQLNVVLLGQGFLAATPDRSSVVGGYGNAGLDWQMGRVTLFALGEATYTSDVARTYAGKGGVRVTW